MSKNGAEPSSRASSMRPPPEPPSRFTLMTPSASPPIQRPFGRHSSTPSPVKKRRVSRAPSVPAPGLRGFSVASASSSSASPAFNFDAPVDPGEELDAARRASSFRVLDVWSQLAEKYARRLDEDDIVDLKKGTIIKDCGVLRSSEDTFEIGYFAEEREKTERLDNGLPLVPVDDEPDELDAFADLRDNVSRSETEGDDEDGLELAQHTKRLPPVRELDPADAADLAEFLRAEQVRRETFGDPDEDDEEYGSGEDEEDEDTEANVLEGSETGGKTAEYGAHSSDDEEEDKVYQERVHESDDERNIQQDYLRFSTPSGSPEIDVLDISKESDDDELAEPVTDVPPTSTSDVESDDELGGWDRDEGNTLYSVADFDEERTDGEEHGETENASATPEPRLRLRKKKGANAEKEVPSDKPKTTRRNSKSVETAKAAVPSRSPSITQLQTPPRSTSFGPESRDIKITTTYSRKRRGTSSSPRKAPMRIQSTTSEDSASEAEEPSPSKGRNQAHPVSPNPSPTKRAKLIPEVYIDALPPSPSKGSKVESAVKSNDPDPSARYDQIATQKRSAKSKGKARAINTNHSTPNRSDAESRPFSPPEASENARSSYSQDSEDYTRAESSRKVALANAENTKRRRGQSPVLEEFHETRTIDVVMNSPTSSPTRSASRRVSSSRRRVLREGESYDEPVHDSSTRPSSSRRSRSRPSAEHAPSSRSHPIPELNNFPFSPPHLPHVGYPGYPGPHYHPAPLPHQHPVPNLQDPNAQYHLAQALQSLSILMGGTLPFPSSPVHATPVHHQPPHPFQNGHQFWSPYTPRHQNHQMTFETPQSVATEPPSSPPLGSDYSDSVPSSPTKRPIHERGRSQVQSSSPTKSRPKSAIRESTTRSRSRSRSSRRVSFSSPEATQIEDNAYVYASDNVIEVGSSGGEDSDFERRRLRREEHSSRSLRLQTPRRHARAQTPGPPDLDARPESTSSNGGAGTRNSSRSNREQPHNRVAHNTRSTATPRRTDGKGYR